MRIENHFHIKGRVLNLVLIQRPGGTKKWRIGARPFSRGISFRKWEGRSLKNPWGRGPPTDHKVNDAKLFKSQVSFTAKCIECTV